MILEIQFTTEPIPRPLPSLAGDAGCGALVEFYGTVRGSEEGNSIAGLRYELYAAMAEREIRRIIQDLALSFPCHAVRVVHRHGFVPVGNAAIYVGIQSAHRQEAFGLLSSFMDRLKRDVPIWKTEAVPC